MRKVETTGRGKGIVPICGIQSPLTRPIVTRFKSLWGGYSENIALGHHIDALTRLESLLRGHSENIALGLHIDVLARLESLWGDI